MAENDNDHRTRVYTLQNETIEVLYNAQKETKTIVREINSHLGNLIPSASRQSLYLFPFTDSVNLNVPIKAIKEIFLNQIIQIESNNYLKISIDYEEVLDFIDNMETYDAFKIAEHIKNEYFHNDEHILKRIKSDCRRLIPIDIKSSSDETDKRNGTVIKLRALKNPYQSLNCLESLGKLVDITLNNTPPSEAKIIEIQPGGAHIDETMKLYYFKNGNVRLVFNDVECTEKMIDALELGC
ncbi:hypothetical protein SAMN04488589_2096 [Methanolobus vulcani]|uniref:Uncharacterized protein n=1 Tax=Methanolobus vulcani TaxID=38026 RepID=A0A7Z7FD50_9EURY|nr:hypothetical protein [Methanolobus vulcani]MDK2826401.1 hypothetical protein [Methanolobus sp.]SDG06408.1 hypothetical protein SAMN04488589_2096 [Methanolobus vulcani]